MALRKPSVTSDEIIARSFGTPKQSEDGQREDKAKARLDHHFANRLRLGGFITYYDAHNQHVIETSEGVRPLIEGEPLPAMPTSAEFEIRELAFKEGIFGDNDDHFEFGKSIAQLAGDDGETDEVQRMIINLRKADIMDGIELTKLHFKYLQERDI